MRLESPIGVLAQSAPSDGRETLTQALRSAWLPLESGLAASAREGTPLSAKYEIDPPTTRARSSELPEITSADPSRRNETR